MKKKKTKLFMSLSVLIICFLISVSSLNITSTIVLVEEENNQYNTDSINGFVWELDTTEVVSTESSGKSYHPSQTVDSIGNVHVTWDDQTALSGSGGDYDIFYKRWNKLTSSWTTTEVVSTESTDTSANPSIAVDVAGNVHIAWEDWTDYAGSGGDWDIFYKRWNASTSTWTTTEVVSTESTAASYYPSLAVDSSGNVHIAWWDSTNYAGSGNDWDIFYKRWDSSTSLWTISEVVSTESTTHSYYPALTIDAAGNVHIVWQDLTDYAGAGTGWDIFYKRWNASTSLWTTTEVVSTESILNSNYPALTTDAAGNVHATWEDWTDYAGSGTDSDIFYKRRDTSTSLWTTTEVVSTESTGNSSWSSLDTDAAGNVHIVWQDSTDYAGNGTDIDIFYKRRDTSTSLWTTTEVVSTESTGGSYYPLIDIADNGCDYHVVWYDTTDYGGAGTDSDIFYKGTVVYFSSPSIWELDTTEVVSTESSAKSYHPSQTVDSIGNVHVTWDDQTALSGSGGDYDIFYKRWNKLTSSWTTTEVVSTESTDTSSNPSIAVDVAGNVHIAWEDETDYAGSGEAWDIFYKRWNASTSTWITTEVVSTESTIVSNEPSLAVDAEGNVHIAWRKWTGTDFDIFYKRWDSSTSLWTISEVVSTESTGYSFHPSLAIDGAGNVHTTWEDWTDYAGSGTDYDIFYKCWNVSTSLWTTTEVVSTESILNSNYPTLTTDATRNVHIVWEDETNYAGAGGDYDIFYKCWNVSTYSWTMTEVVSTESTDASSWSSLDADALGNANIVWQDSTDYAGNGTDWDIFYKRRDTSTSLWTTTEVVSTESTDDSYYPSICVDSSGCVFHVVWCDSTDYAGAGTDTDIFYKGAIVDFSSPLITDVTYIPSEPTFDDQITISANVTDNVEVYNATLYYCVNGGSWFSASMIASETIYSAIIGPFAAGSTIDYYLITHDTSGNSAQSSTMNFEIAIVIEEFGIISSLILGTLTITVAIMKIRKKKSKTN